MVLQKGTMQLLWYAQAEGLDIVQSNLIREKPGSSSLPGKRCLSRKVLYHSSAIAGISSFCLKNFFQKQLWKINVNQEYKLLRCLNSIYILPSPKPNHRMSDYLVIVYQRERFAKIVGFHLSAPSLKNPHTQRWKCLKCKCVRTPG